MKGYYIERFSRSSPSSTEGEVRQADEVHCESKQVNDDLVITLDTLEIPLQQEVARDQKWEHSSHLDRRSDTRQRFAVDNVKPLLLLNAAERIDLSRNVGINSNRGEGIMDVATLIFGFLFLITLAFSLLFFGAAVFAQDSLVAAIWLMIGGSFLFISLVLMVIWLILRKKATGRT